MKMINNKNRVPKMNFLKALLVAFFGFIFQVGSFAQDVNQDFLKDFQKNQRATSNPVSILDEYREEELTEEEREARKKARLELEKINNSFSRIEIDYQNRIGKFNPDSGYNPYEVKSDNTSAGNEDIQLESQDTVPQYFIRQFGYDIFGENLLSTNNNIGEISDDYVLGVGDVLIVNLVGPENNTIVVQVDKEGRVVIDDVEPVPAMGRSFASFKNELKSKVAETMLGTEVFVSIGRVRRINVYVLGEVSMPGVQSMTSLSSVLQALASAGGVKKTGSLRNIQVQSNGISKVLDIYQLLENGEGASISLSEGARIIVPTIGKTVAISGKVVKPAIFELKENSKGIPANDLLSLAGGGLRDRGNDFLLNHIDNEGRQVVSSLLDMENLVVGSDLLQVNYKRDVKVGEISLLGHVRVVGGRSLDSAPTISKLIDGVDSLKDDPYLPFAVLETTNAISQAREFKAVNLGNILSDKSDIPLKNRDKLFVLGMNDVNFLSSQGVQEVIVSGKLEENSCPSLIYLSKFVGNGDDGRFSAVTNGVFSSNEDFEKRNQNISRTKEVAEDENSVPSNFPVPQNADFINTPEQTNKSKNCNQFFDENQDLFLFAIENSVSVMGSIRRPGVYPVAESSNLSTLESIAGGFSNTADVENIEILKYSGKRQNERDFGSIRVNAKDTPLETVEIKPGSHLRVNQLRSNQELGTVLLMGEFLRPGVYSISRGETLSQLIERAGGLTKYAYPFGAVMTKQSVKELQKEGFRRAAREINGALAIAAVRTNMEAGTLMAAQNLSKDLESVEAIGRVVVEADPVVLRMKPELDSILDGGDTIVMPKKPNFVTVVGDVLSPGAMQFIPGKKIKTYLAESGGYQRSADKKRVYVVYPNGIAEPIKKSMWSSSDLMLPPGATIVVPKNLKTYSSLDIISQISTVIGQLALSAASIAVIAQ